MQLGVVGHPYLNFSGWSACTNTVILLTVSTAWLQGCSIVAVDRRRRLLAEAGPAPTRDLLLPAGPAGRAPDLQLPSGADHGLLRPRLPWEWRWPWSRSSGAARVAVAFALSSRGACAAPPTEYLHGDPPGAAARTSVAMPDQSHLHHRLQRFGLDPDSSSTRGSALPAGPVVVAVRPTAWISAVVVVTSLAPASTVAVTCSEDGMAGALALPSASPRRSD